MKMKIKEGYLLRTVAGSNIVVPIGEGAIDFSGVITLNEVGAFLWRALEEGVSKEELVKKLTSEYEVDEATASADIDTFAARLREASLLDD